jgi:uncharacterized protein (DUF433 family)
MASAASTLKVEYGHIVHTPGTMGGQARIDGHRIRVRDVAIARDIDGLSPEEIATQVYPSLSLAEVYAALAYYEDHREEIQRAEENELSVVEQFRRDHPELTGKLSTRTE